MIYILVFVALIGIYTYVSHRSRTNSIKHNGVKATGVIIDNKEFNVNETRGLGGNINNPFISFATKEGRVITGKPVTGFISQYEIALPYDVNIVYNAKNPKEFYIDFE